MNLDSVSLKAIVKELTPMLLGGVLQKISQLTRLDVVMQVRRPGVTHKLLLRLGQNSPGLGLTNQKLPPAEAPSSFIMLLRKHLQGHKIDKIEQHGLERLVKFYVDDKVLVLELFNRSNNLYLLNAPQKIMGMLVRDTKEDSQQAGKPYRPPALPTKPDASLVTYADLPKLFAPFLGQPAAKVLSASLFGLSNQQIGLIVKMAGLAPDEPLSEDGCANLAIALDQWQMFLEEDSFSPVISSEGKVSPWSLQDPGEKPIDSLLGLLDDLAAPVGIDDRRGPLLRSLQKAKDKAQIVLERRLEALESTRSAPLMRWAGEAILAHIYAVAPASEHLFIDLSSEFIDPETRTLLEAQNSTEKLSMTNNKSGKKVKAKRSKLMVGMSEEQIAITLDPLLNAGDNAQAYFKEYHRLKRAVEAVQEPIRKAREELEFLDDLLYFTESAVEAQELEDIRRQWNDLKISENPQLKSKATRSVQTGPQGPKAFLYKDFKILVGRNPRQNDQLTFKIAALGDIWLHAHNSPGAHVVIKAAGRRIPAEVLEAAAVLAARSCKVRNSTKVEVSYCDLKQVKKPKGSPPGLVLLKSFKVITVSPHQEIAGLNEYKKLP